MAGRGQGTGTHTGVLLQRQPVTADRVDPMIRRLSSIPDWVIGLVLAIVVTAVLYVVFGAGDDPTLAGG
jgi:hypothetical protein